jgi:hypothetical protein
MIGVAGVTAPSLPGLAQPGSGHQQTFDGGVLMVLQLVFVAHHLAIEFVHQDVDRGI